MHEKQSQGGSGRDGHRSHGVRTFDAGIVAPWTIRPIIYLRGQYRPSVKAILAGSTRPRIGRIP
jgi:hypothetical protein